MEKEKISEEVEGKKVNNSSLRKDELIKKLEESEKKNDELFSIIKSLKDEMDSIKNSQPQYVIQQGVNDKEISIGCRLFCGATLLSPSGEIQIRVKCGEETTLTIHEMQEIFRNQFRYKRLFEKGVLYFVDEEMYDYFKIRNVLDLSDEALVDALTGSVESMKSFLANITDNKRDDMVEHTICYKTAKLLDSGKLGDWSYGNRVGFDAYMGVKIENIIKLMKKIENSSDIDLV